MANDREDESDDENTDSDTAASEDLEDDDGHLIYRLPQSVRAEGQARQRLVLSAVTQLDPDCIGSETVSTGDGLAHRYRSRACKSKITHVFSNVVTGRERYPDEVYTIYAEGEDLEDLRYISTPLHDMELSREFCQHESLIRGGPSVPKWFGSLFAMSTFTCDHPLRHHRRHTLATSQLIHPNLQAKLVGHFRGYMRLNRSVEPTAWEEPGTKMPGALINIDIPRGTDPLYLVVDEATGLIAVVSDKRYGYEPRPSSIRVFATADANLDDTTTD